MNLLNEYLNKWHSLLTTFALEGRLKDGILSTITDNKSHQYITLLNKQLEQSSYESLQK